MKTHFLLLTVAATPFAFAGCAAAPRRGADLPAFEPRTTTPEPVTLKTGGPPGQHFTAALTVDGVPREITGVTPAAYPLECIVLTGEVTHLSGTGPFYLEVARRNGSAFTPHVNGTSRFRYHDGGIEVLGGK